MSTQIQDLHPGEPYFIIRGQDSFAPAAITAYGSLVAQNGNTRKAGEVFDMVDVFREWQSANPDKIKKPD